MRLFVIFVSLAFVILMSVSCGKKKPLDDYAIQNAVENNDDSTSLLP